MLEPIFGFVKDLSSTQLLTWGVVLMALGLFLGTNLGVALICVMQSASKKPEGSGSEEASDAEEVVGA